MGCGGSRADAIIEPRYHESWTRETESTWLTNTDVESTLPGINSKGLEGCLKEKRMVNTGTQCGKQGLSLSTSTTTITTTTGCNHQRRARRSCSDQSTRDSRRRASKETTSKDSPPPPPPPPPPSVDINCTRDAEPVKERDER